MTIDLYGWGRNTVNVGLRQAAMLAARANPSLPRVAVKPLEGAKMKRILGVTALVMGATAMIGCTDNSKRIAYDGQYFRAKAAKVDKQRDVFVVSVRDVSRSLDGARQAAYHAGVSYCLANFGSSDILWQQNPLDEETALQVVDDTISVQGRCPQAIKI